MQTYNYIIEEAKEWKKFKKNYKLEGLGKNLNKAITSLIKKFNKEIKK